MPTPLPADFTIYYPRVYYKIVKPFGSFYNFVKAIDYEFLVQMIIFYDLHNLFMVATLN